MSASFVAATFRAQFPEFSNSTTYPDATLSGYWVMGESFITNADGYMLKGQTLQMALDLMAAHLAKSFTMINQGQTTAIVSGSSEGSVSVSLTPPPVKNAWQWWLSTTPYGAQLRALLQVVTAGGFYVGGSLERASFRKAAGVW